MNRNQNQPNPVQPENQNHIPPAPHQNCPRCESSNTKFCYYNNYSLSQPRYFCKACRRYWTQGGTLRNVPIGGGCRKSKRSKLSTTTASSSTSEVARTLTLPTTGIPGQHNFTGMIADRAGLLTPVIPPTGNYNNSFYTGGPIFSSLVAMQSPASLGGGGGGRYAALLSSMRPQAVPAQQFQANNNDFYLSSQQGLIPPRPVNSWTQRFINGGAASTSGHGSAGFWSGATRVDGGDLAGSSFNPNPWSFDKNPGFNPPPQ